MTRHALLSETPNSPSSCATARRRESGVRIFPRRTPSACRCRGPGSVGVVTDVDEWEQPDAAVDLAVLDWFPPREEYDYNAFVLNQVATDEVMAQFEIGIGDEVFAVGPLRNHLGRRRIEPIVRVGNIAALPADEVRTRWGPMKGILVEARSIGAGPVSGDPLNNYRRLCRRASNCIRPA